MNMSNERKKELQAQYKQLKSAMGLFAIINKSNSRYYLETTQNLKGRINSTKFKLNAGVHPNQALQKDWLEVGADGFEIKILEQIDYDKDEAKTDYSDELEILRMIWIEKLTTETVQFYQEI